VGLPTRYLEVHHADAETPLGELGYPRVIVECGVLFISGGGALVVAGRPKRHSRSLISRRAGTDCVPVRGDVRRAKKCRQISAAAWPSRGINCARARERHNPAIRSRALSPTQLQTVQPTLAAISLSMPCRTTSSL